MIAKAEQKFVKVTPRKLRLVADMARKMKPEEAVIMLPYVEKRASSTLQKVIKTAIANARVLGMTESNLVFDSIQITDGPRLKRFRPVSRGRAHGYMKKMSHIRITVVEKKVEDTKQEKSTKEVAKPVKDVAEKKTIKKVQKDVEKTKKKGDSKK